MFWFGIFCRACGRVVVCEKSDMGGKVRPPGRADGRKKSLISNFFWFLFIIIILFLYKKEEEKKKIYEFV